MSRKHTPEDLFQENLELFSKAHPREAVMLQFFSCKSVEFCKANNGKLNLCKNDQVFYAMDDPEKEALEWAGSLNLSSCSVLYVYGVGLGYYYIPIKEWLGKDLQHHVVFLEDDMEVIARLFETELGNQLLSDPQVSLFTFNEVAETETLFNHLYWKFPMSKFCFGALRHYGETKAQTYCELCHQISYDAAVKDALLEEYLHYGVSFYRNYYPNMLHLGEASLGNQLFGKFKSIPAIICGAGPSLNKNISLLKELRKKAVIFAGSSALNALDAAGIQPHLGVGIDPNPMQQARLSKVARLDFPFLYRNRVYPGALKCVKGPKLFLTGAGGYDIAEWFEKKLGIEGQFVEEGRNVVNFSLEIAYEMGCDPIIFVGMDLAYTGMKAYTSGVIEDPLMSEKDLPPDTVKRKDIFGQEVLTEWKWISEAKWIADFRRVHDDVELINATEGGLGFSGIENTTLKELSTNTLKNTFDHESIIEEVIKQHSLSHISRAQILNAFEELKKGLKRCLEDLRVLEEENEKVIKKIQRTKRAEHNQTGRAALIETELADDPVFVAVLQIFNDVCSRWLQKDLLNIYHPKNKAAKDEKEVQKLELNAVKYKFLKNAAKVNLELIEKALTEH